MQRIKGRQAGRQGREGGSGLRKIEILLVGISMLVTLALFIGSLQDRTDTAQDEFDRLTEDSVMRLQMRMSTYLQTLNSTAAYLKSGAEATPDEFDVYVDTLDIATFLPGISGIGFIEPVVSSDPLPADGAETDTSSAAGQERFIISRISPLEPNREALGLDITFEQGRRDAALRARATGMPQLTPRILLVQDQTKQPGFLLVRPVFVDREGEGSEGADGKTFLGWVYAPFVGSALLTDLNPGTDSAYEFAVYDGERIDPEQVIYSSLSEIGKQGAYDAQYTVDQFGRKWTITFQSTGAFEAAFRSLAPIWILVFGGVLSVLLLLLVRNQRVRSDALAELAALRSRQISAREEENRSVVENAVTAVFVLDQDRQVRFVNQAAEECFAYSAAEMENMAFDELVKEVAEDVSGGDFNAISMTKDGTPLVLDLQCNEWVTHDGEQRTTAIVRNLTAEFEAVRELKNTKSIYDLALKSGHIGVFDIDLRTGTSEVSDTWLQIMGYEASDPDQNTQAAFLSRVHPADLETLKTADQKCIDGSTGRSTTEFRLRFPNDEWRWMRSDAVVVEWDADGKARRMIGTQTDITDLRRSRNALETSEKRFRQVVSAAPIGMALVSDQGEFLDFNDAFCDLCGYSRAALNDGVRLSDLMSRDELKKVFHDVMAMVGTHHNDVYRGEHRIVHKSGSERWGLFNISCTYDPNTQANFYIAQINDITDLKEIEQLKNEFVSTVSHELRTPLTSIKGALGLIHAAPDSGLSASSRRLIDIARLNTDRLTTIVNDILDLEKISSGEVAFHFDTYDMSEIVLEAVKEMSPFALTHNNSFRMDVPDDPIWVRADHGRTKQVLANLMSNACKYSHDGSEIVIKAERLADVAIIYVQNTGAGIPEGFKSRLFEAFSQADSSDTRAKGGTGLGLNITRQIVARHDGKIGFESIPNSVTVFWFTCPLSEDVPDDRQPAPARTQQAKAEKLKVVHLEDDRDFAEVIRSGLHRVADVTHAKDLSAARMALEGDDVDVLILDWSIPGGDPGTLVAEVHKQHPDIRILGLSADSDQRRDNRLYANLVKSRTELETIADYVAGRVARVS